MPGSGPGPRDERGGGLGAMWRRFRIRRRARREAKALVRLARGALRRSAYRIGEAVRAELILATGALERALAAGDHDATCVGMVRLDELAERHLGFARKSTFREYAESIAAAVMIALFLRTFVVEAFKIPSGSMLPTLEVGDHIFVNKFIYGVTIPFTDLRLFDQRKPRRGEVIVFIYPKEPDKDFIKRIIAVEGDTVLVTRQQEVIVNGAAVPRDKLPGRWPYQDYEEHDDSWRKHEYSRYAERHGGTSYTTVMRLEKEYFHVRDLVTSGGEVMQPGGSYAVGEPFEVPRGHVFVMGDNRNNSHDSRFWGAVPVGNIKGKALVVWWSSG
ncbi:MAG: signal peptidase I, partial [Myxococcales bacterium]|nr:signal peptidase I [Myxococcales bacterium]